MFRLTFNEEIGRMLDKDMPNWCELNKQIHEGTVNQVLRLAHITTKHRLEAAFFHLLTMDQIYRKETSFHHYHQFAIRLSGEGIFFALAGSLDSLAHEINQFYNLGVDFSSAQMDHFDRKNGTQCVRCQLNHHDNELANYLENEFPRRSPADHWYHTFSQYRHQVVHRTVYVIAVQPHGLLLPDNPSEVNPQLQNTFDKKNPKKLIHRAGFSQEREMKKYCMECFVMIRERIEAVYARMLEQKSKVNSMS